MDGIAVTEVQPNRLTQVGNRLIERASLGYDGDLQTLCDVVLTALEDDGVDGAAQIAVGDFVGWGRLSRVVRWFRLPRYET